MKSGVLTKKVQISTEALAALLLLIVLSGLTSLIIIETGSAYRSLVSDSESSQEIRTALNFTATRIRQVPNGDLISVRKSPWGQNAIVISRPDGKDVYEDWLFYYGGAFREVLIPEGSEINPGSAQIIGRLDSFSVQKEGNLIRISAKKSTSIRPAKVQEESLSLCLRTRNP